MARQIGKLKERNLSPLQLKETIKNEIIKYKNSIKKNFLKLAGRSFGAYQSRAIDGFLTAALHSVCKEYFEDFLPQNESLPICVIGLGSYGANELSVKSDIGLFIVYKNLKGYKALDLADKLLEFIHDVDLEVLANISECSEIFKLSKDDISQKTSLSQFRYICGSKTLYKLARSEFNALKEYKKDEFLKFHLNELAPYDEIYPLAQEADLKAGYGGIKDASRLEWILSYFKDISTRENMLKFITQKELGEYNLSVDYLISLRSAVHICGGGDEIKSSFFKQTSQIMQTKEKRLLVEEQITAQKMLASMHTVAIFSRYVASCVKRRYFKGEFEFCALRSYRDKSGFYLINSTVFSPLNKKEQNLKNLLKSLNLLPDRALKFDISAIFFLKRAQCTELDQKVILNEFKKLLKREYNFDILRALLNSELLFLIIKPMSHTRHLAQLDGYHKLSVDEHSVMSIYHLENIADEFIKSLFGTLKDDEILVVKIALLMHDVGKGLGGDHSVVGANIFRAFASKFLNLNLVNLGLKLIKHHTLMNNVAHTEDIYNQRVIFGFISKLGDKSVLKLLYILTYCDILATDAKLYNSYSAKLFKELYEISLQSFDDENLLDEATRRVKKEASIRRQSDFICLDENQKNRLFSINSNLLFIKYSPIDIIKIAKKAMNSDTSSIQIINQQNLIIEIIDLASRLNLAYLLTKLADFDLGYMEIFELFDDKLFVKLEFNKQIPTTELDRFLTLIKSALLSTKAAKTQKPIIYENELTFDENHSKTYARLNINAKDQRGLMAFVISVFDNFELKIASARIQTIKNRTRNLFLIQKSVVLSQNCEEILKQIIMKRE